MSNIVADSRAPAPDSIECPSWCVTDHSRDLLHLEEPGYAVTHDGEAQTFGETTVSFGDQGPRAVVMFQTMSTLADGTVVEEGAMLSGHFLTIADLESLVSASAALSGR